MSAMVTPTITPTIAAPVAVETTNSMIPGIFYVIVAIIILYLLYRLIRWIMDGRSE